MIFLLVGCLTGNSYPSQFANARCKTGYACVDPVQIEDQLGYENIDECIAKIEAQTRSTDSFEEFQAGEKDFNKENAEACISETLNIQEEASCNGQMDVFSFFYVTTKECENVYE